MIDLTREEEEERESVWRERGKDKRERDSKEVIGCKVTEREKERQRE